MKRKLTPKTIEHLKAEGRRRREVWDTTLPGFGIRAYGTGRKVWFVIARVKGRQRRFTIGTYPVLALGEARTKARKILRDVQMGLYDESPGPISTTLGEAVALFVTLYAKPKNRGWRETERILGKFALLYDRPLDEIRRAEIVRVLDTLVANGTPYRVNRALSAIKKLLNWALNRGMIDVNPIAGQRMPTKECARDRVLSDDELGRLICAAKAGGYPFGTIYLMLLLTGQRRGEVSAMRWSEIDLQRRLWTIPAARAKNGHAHEVPLSSPVIDILRQVPRFLHSDFVFTTNGQRSVSGFGRAKGRFERAVGSIDWRVHDLRRTAASGMARLGIPPHVIEKVLNHRTGVISGVAAVYNRYGYAEEKRDALERWAQWVLRISVVQKPSVEASTTVLAS
jgi:integrase